MPRILVVRVSKKEAIVYYISKKYSIVYDIPVDNEETLRGGGGAIRV